MPGGGRSGHAVKEQHEERVEGLKRENESLRREKEGLKKNLARLNAHNHREPLRIQHAVRKALKYSNDTSATQPTIHYVKDRQGIIQDWARNAILMLVNEGVPMSKTWAVMEANAKALGVMIVGKWSIRTSCRVVHEGGIAAGLMIVEYVLKCIAATLSSDGTAHKSIQYLSRHAVAIPPDGDPPKDCFLGITPKVNHTTNTQFAGWKQTIQHLCDNYNKSPLGNKVPANPTRIWGGLRGYLSDHASDQKKLSAMLQRYWWECDCQLRGEAVMPLDEYTEDREQVLMEKGSELMQEIGGPEHYHALSIDEQLQFTKRLEKEIVDYWVWSGCAMHKDLNAMKGGVDRMSSWWVKFGDGVTPVALMSKYKVIAADSGSVPEENLVGPGDRGGVKLTDLLGSLIKHREMKKGHQECFRAFSIEFLGSPRPVQFPDTSNNRYQSHGLAATEILFHLDLYLAFLQSIADLKSLGNELNHLERNV
ncbi:hypothetical protein BDM02DRAFT_3193083 [Thelephora ganbajun]|uniref:Uncharacterized protein n=1 Tax=Thelephora ganbajun TaxID=370292 RepID=A0ACB6YZ39_THEGA|nr:hypothetical protein BDM02DRAFT_3193083 [Thelephora ganbajun]